MSDAIDDRLAELRSARAVRRWFYAAKPASWSKVVVPAVFGQVLGACFAAAPSMSAAALGLAFTASTVLFIVLLNDYADQSVDSLKRAMFPDGCSPKTIVDGILPARALLVVGLACGAVALLLAALSQHLLQRSNTLSLAVVCLFLFVGYSLPPLRLNYRGGGELLEMLGVGVALPTYNMHLQSPAAARFAWPLLWGLALLALSSALASGLSDEESDQRGGKSTFVTAQGNAAARRWIEIAALGGLAAWLASPIWASLIAWPVVVAPVVVGGWHLLRLSRASEAAKTNQFRAIGVYKEHLHRLIAQATLTFAGALAFARVFFF